MSASLSFEVVARDGRARAGVLTTPHGPVETPVFMPVGTAGAVKAVTRPRPPGSRARRSSSRTPTTSCCVPGDELVRELGGLHGFTGWRGPFLTDSGGYQVFSLTALRKLDEEGVRFQSHLDGSSHLLTPERSIEVQKNLGADIVMAFDECPPWPRPREAVAESDRPHHDAGPRGRAPRTGGTTSGSSASCRAASSSTSAKRARARSRPSIFRGTRSAECPWGSRRRTGSACSTSSTRSCPRRSRATSWGWERPRTSSREWRAASTCSTACSPPGTRETDSSSRDGAGSRSGTRGSATTPGPPIPTAPVRPAAPRAVPTSGTSTSRGEMTAATLMTVHNLFFYLDMMRSHAAKYSFVPFRGVPARDSPGPHGRGGRRVVDGWASPALDPRSS